MANDIFHTAHSPSHHHHHQDIGQQALSLFKIVIFVLTFAKLLQLAFLKYRRKLTLSERVEKKYRYSHNQLINNYSDGERKLMEATIGNTIKNAQVVSPAKQTKGRAHTIRVSFDTAKNNYYQHKDQIGVLGLSNEENTTTPIEGEKEVANLKLNSKQSLTEHDPNSTNPLGQQSPLRVSRQRASLEQDNMSIMSPALSSKLTQETDQSTLLDSSSSFSKTIISSPKTPK